MRRDPLCVELALRHNEPRNHLRTCRVAAFCELQQSLA